MQKPYELHVQNAGGYDVCYFDTQDALDEEIETVTNNAKGRGLKVVTLTPNYPIENDVVIVFVDFRR